jgi:hypothetical protein
MNIVMDGAAIVVALLIFVGPALAEELPVNPAVTQASIGGTNSSADRALAVQPAAKIVRHCRQML